MLFCLLTNFFSCFILLELTICIFYLEEIKKVNYIQIQLGSVTQLLSLIKYHIICKVFWVYCSLFKTMRHCQLNSCEKKPLCSSSMWVCWIYFYIHYLTYLSICWFYLRFSLESISLFAKCIVCSFWNDERCVKFIFFIFVGCYLIAMQIINIDLLPY